MSSASLVTDFALVLGVAAVTGTAARALKQPPILGYLLAGLVVGPYIPIPLFADVERVHELSEFGVVLVMFAVGLEFSIARAMKVLPTAGLTAVVQIAGMFFAGNILGTALGLSTVGAVLLGACLAVSSTMVVTKVFDLHPPPNDVREVVLGVLVLQDLVAIVLITVVTALAEGAELQPAALAVVVGKLAGLVAIVVIGGLVFVPRLTRYVSKIRTSEVHTMFAIGLCFALAAGMETMGYPAALGAFLAGMLVAESGVATRFEHLVVPLRDVFSAVFFVSIGMTVDPRVAWGYLPEATAIAAVIVALQFVLVGSAGLLSGLGLRRSGHAGLAMGQIGEFAFIIVGIGVAADVLPASMFTVIVMVAVLTAISTVVSLRIAPRVLTALEDRIPPRLRGVMGVYSTWLDSLRPIAKETPAVRRHVLRCLSWQLTDGGVIVALVIGSSQLWDATATWAAGQLGLSPPLTHAALVVIAGLLATPFALGMWRSARTLGRQVASAAFSEDENPSAQADPASPAYRATALGLQIGTYLAAVVLVAAVAGPFAHPSVGLALLAVAVLPGIISVALQQRSLSEAVGSTSLALLEALRDDDGHGHDHDHDHDHDHPAAEVQELLHQLGDAITLRLPAGAHSIGKTLAQINLRATTGATVLAIAHGDQDVSAPSGAEVLKEGDVLALAGPSDAVQRARTALLKGSPNPGPNL